MKQLTRKIIVSTLLSMVFGLQAFAIDNAPAFDDPALQARYQALTRQLRCLVCQNETIADSNAQLAGDLRRELRGLLASGKSDEEVVKFLTDRYGDFVLYKPPFAARTWLLWSAPALALIAAIGTAIAVIRRRAQMPLDGADENNNEVETP